MCYIPKPDGRQRPLGIPTVKDRIVQMAVLLVLEPIFEADFLDCSFGFRPGKNAHQAIDAIRQHLAAGLQEVYDADLQGYFDTIPHDQLLKCLQMRIADRSVLHADPHVAEAPVVERDDADGRQTTRPTQGTPQGGVISPLVGEYLPALVREGVSSVGWTRRTGPTPGSCATRTTSSSWPAIRDRQLRRLDRIATRRPLPLDHQPREDARGEAARTGGEPELPGLHVPLRPRPVWSRTEVSERVSLEEVVAPAARQTAGD